MNQFVERIKLKINGLKRATNVFWDCELCGKKKSQFLKNAESLDQQAWNSAPKIV